MKRKILFLLIATAVALGCNEAIARQPIKVKGDTLQLVENGDTLQVSIKAFVKGLASVGNETVYADTPPAEDLQAFVENSIDETRDRIAEDFRREAEVRADRSRRDGFIFTMIITGIIAGAILLIIIAALIVFYLNRRNKYRMMERAIENGYELPPSITGNAPAGNPAPPIPNQPYQQNPYYGAQQPPMGFSQQPPMGAAPQQPLFGQQQPPFYGQPQQQPPTTPPPFSQEQPYAPIQWNIDGFKNGIIWSTIGLCLMFFFIAVDGEEMAIICMPVLIIGIYKLFSEYVRQRNSIAYERWQAQRPTSQQGQQHATHEDNNKDNNSEQQ